MNAIEKLRLQSLSLKQEELIIEPITYQSKGAVPKVWCNINGIVHLVKSSLFGEEPFSEVLASNLAEVLGLKHIPYLILKRELFKDLDLGEYEYVSICPKQYLLKGQQISSLYNVQKELCGLHFDSMNDFTYVDPKDYLFSLDRNILNEMFTLLNFDAIIGNVDRHFNNIEFIKADDTLVSLFPRHDCGMSFMFDNSVDFYAKEESKPFKRTHNEQIEYLKELGYSSFIEYDKDTINKWESFSKEIFALMPTDKVSKLIYFTKVRLEYYGKLRR